MLLKVSSAAEDDFVRLNLLWTGFFGETCKLALHNLPAEGHDMQHAGQLVCRMTGKAQPRALHPNLY